MRTRAFGAALVLAFGAVLAVQGQGPSGSRVVVVAADPSTALTAWKAGGAGFEQVWRGVPRTADDDIAKRRAEVFGSAGAAWPIVADVDADGSNDLAVLDPYGITVYGRTPSYYPLPVTHDNARLALLDADGDGALDFVTQRIQGGSAVIEAYRRTPAGLVSLWSRPMTGYRTGLVSGDVDGDGQTGADFGLRHADDPEAQGRRVGRRRGTARGGTPRYPPSRSPTSTATEERDSSPEGRAATSRSSSSGRAQT